MKEVLELIITNLVNNKNEISIDEVVDENIVTYKIKVSKEDIGRIIGRQGKVARAIRTVMKSVSARENKKVNIEFID